MHKVPSTNNKTQTSDMSSRRRKSSNPTAKSAHINVIATRVSDLGHRLYTKRGTVITGIVIIAATGYIILTPADNQQADQNKAVVQTSQVVENLEYQTILPADKPITELGGWRRISPPDSEPVYAYSDNIGAVAVTVSQQPIPKSFKDNTSSHLADMAKKGSYTTKLDADGVGVYIGTSAKGPQSIMFVKNSLLILIKSQQKIDDTAWVSYIKSLN